MARFRKDTGAYDRHLVWDDSRFYDGLGMASDGAYLYVTGLTIVPFGGGQIFVQKWDKDFNLIWEQQWGGPGSDTARAVGLDSQGRIVVAGNATDEGDRRIVLLVYDGGGTLLSEAIFDGAGDDVVHGLWIDGEYVYLAGETTNPNAGMFDAMLVRARIYPTAFPEK